MIFNQHSLKNTWSFPFLSFFFESSRTDFDSDFRSMLIQKCFFKRTLFTTLYSKHSPVERMLLVIKGGKKNGRKMQMSHKLCTKVTQCCNKPKKSNIFFLENQKLKIMSLKYDALVTGSGQLCITYLDLFVLALAACLSVLKIYLFNKQQKNNIFLF